MIPKYPIRARTGSGEIDVATLDVPASAIDDNTLNLSSITTVPVQTTQITIATTGNSDAYIFAHATGTVTSIIMSGATTLATSDTNYITFSVTNLGQAGAGSAALLAATAANTTQVTGGSAVTANTKRTLTLTDTTANLSVTAGDRLLVRAAVTGTLANTVTFAITQVVITRS